MEEVWIEFIGKRVKVVYEDNTGETRTRIGSLKAISDGLLVLEQDKPYPTLFIRVQDIRRVEVLA